MDRVSTRRSDFQCLEFRPTPSTGQTAIVWLHGMGERGSDLMAVARYGLPAALLEGRLSVNAHVICPQLEAGQEWAPLRVKALLTELRSDYPRLALVGFSLGAQGVCNLLAELGPQADVHVAIAPQLQSAVTAAQRGTNFLMLCGEHDPCAGVDAFVEQIRALGGLAEHAVLADAGHYISESALMHPAFLRALSALAIELGAALA